MATSDVFLAVYVVVQMLMPIAPVAIITSFATLSVPQPSARVGLALKGSLASALYVER